MRLLRGDCLDHMRILASEGEQFDAVVTDPPYHLTSIVERFGKAGSAPAQFGKDGAYARASRGFMGKEWDGGDIAFRPDTWRAAYDLLKPGGHLVAFGGSRTYHRIACAIEDAGFEIRDSLMWVYGTGFPKSHDVSKGIDKVAGAVREIVGQRKGQGHIPNDRGEWGLKPNTPVDITAPATPEAAQWAGWGTALKPAFEPIILARKPLDGTVAANTLKHGVGGINIDACRIETSDVDKATMDAKASVSPTGKVAANVGFVPGICTPANALGRWPANVLHDGSDEVMAAFAAYGDRKSTPFRANDLDTALHEGGIKHRTAGGFSDSGSAARFFYSAKASKDDRAGSKHPTVKPLSLMRWLCKLVTPPGGHILDPFGGSGTTLQAAHECGFTATTIEREPEYQADIERRIANANQPVAPKRSEQHDLFGDAA